MSKRNSVQIKQNHNFKKFNTVDVSLGTMES